jgi:hypothetical protein
MIAMTAAKAAFASRTEEVTALRTEEGRSTFIPILRKAG